jgi:hypothetical protein
VDEIVPQPSMSVTPPIKVSYTNQSKPNILKTAVRASKTHVKSKEWKKTALQRRRGNVSTGN